MSVKTTVKFDDKSKEYISRGAAFADMLVANMALGIEIQIKTNGRTPYKQGGLRSHARAGKIAAAHYEVTDDQEYAAAQEAGTTRGHVMKDYTTAGTGKGFFRQAIDNVKERADDYVRIAATATGLKDL